MSDPIRPDPAVTGAELLAGLMAEWGAGPVFHVPGEGALELIEALDRRGAALMTCRHEGGMAFMAQAAGQATGRPGLAVVGRAPGALNAALALHTAFTDGAPLVLIVGQASERQSGREAFLGADFVQSLQPLTKWVGECRDAARLPELFARAWGTALSGRRGPVALIVAEDVWHQRVPAPVALAAPRVEAAAVSPV